MWHTQVVSAYIYFFILENPMNNKYDRLVRYLTVSLAAFALTPSSFALSWIEKNLGQTSASYDYIIRANDLTAMTSSTYIDLMLSKTAENNAGPDESIGTIKAEPAAKSAAHVRLQFLGSNKAATPGAANQMAAHSNYFKGPKDQWISNVPHFGEVRYDNVYAGIDVVYRLNEGQLEYDFVVAPGADPSVIAMTMDGVTARISASGKLQAETPLGKVSQSIPAVYQMVDGKRQLIDGSFEITAAGHIGFSLAEHRNDHPLVIDPVVEFSGYVGGNRSDAGYKLQEKPNGNLVLLGGTTSLFEVIQTPSDLRVSDDVFLAELDRTSGDLLWVTVLGGFRNDASQNFRIDSAGNSVVVGYTSSFDFPVINAFQPDFIGNNTPDDSFLNGDGFVTKVAADGSSLIFSTYLGGTDTPIEDPNLAFGFELFRGIDIDDDDNIFIVGQTSAPDFPVTTTFNGFGCFEQDLDPAIQSGGFSSDITFSKISPTGSLIFSTCIGGSARDAGRSVIVQNDGSVSIAGFTRSSDLPVTAGAFQSATLVPFELTPFVLTLTPDFSQLSMATLVGEGLLQSIDIDGNGDIYGVSTSRGLNTATPGAFQGTYSDDPNDSDYSEGYVFKLSADGTSLLYGTYQGSLGEDSLNVIRVDDEGRAFVAGSTESSTYPLKNPLDEPDTPILRSSDVWFPSSGYNHISRGTLTDRSIVSLLSRNGNNLYAIGDQTSLGQVVPFFPDGNYDTSAMAVSQNIATVVSPAYAAVANRNGPNQIYAFDEVSFTFEEATTLDIFGANSRAVEANFITSTTSFANFYFGNYGTSNVIARFSGFPPVLTISNEGRSDGNTTALTKLSLLDQGVLSDLIAVANEGQDIRMYNSTSLPLGPAIILDINVGPVTAMAAGDLDGDSVSELIIASSDRPVEIVRFGDAGAIESIDLLLEAASENLSLLIEDVDNDGDRDILVGRLGDDKLFLNNGTGDFTHEASYTGNAEATKSLSNRLRPGESELCPCFGIIDQNPQELLVGGSRRAVLSVLTSDGSDLEFSTTLRSGGTDSIFRGLDFANGSDSKVLLASTASGDAWPQVTSSTGRNEATDATVMVLELDQDGDNALDGNDNCTLIANADQNDTDADGYGNACDADFNNDCTVNFLDIAAFADEFLGTNPLFDINGDGVVNFLDFSSVSMQFLSPPGPGLGDCELAP